MKLMDRRELLKVMVMGTGLTVFSPSLLKARARRRESLGVALVGLGYYSTDLLAPALQLTEHCHLAGIVTGTPDKAVEWARQYSLPDKNVYNYDNFDDIADNPDIDVVYVVLPPSMHKEYTVRAANAGKHVWCEKPMAMTEAECQEMIEACRSNKRALSIGYRLQHEPNTQEYRRILREEKLGAVKALECAAGYRENRTDHWKQKKEMGGGVLYDMGVYSIQGARLGTNMEPLAIVSATTSTTRPEIYKNGLDETTEAVLQFPGGVIAKIKTSFGENINYLNIDCEKGAIKMAPFQAYAGVKGVSPLGEINYSYKVPMQQAMQMDNDALAIMQEKPVKVPGEEGLKDIRIVEAIYQSAAGGKQVDL